MKVNVLYFALLRHHRGVAEEVVETSATNVRELYHELKTLHGLQLTAEQLRFAINETICDADNALTDGCTVALMPPASGG